MLEFGAALAGVVLVTVNPGFRANELEYVLKQSRAAGVFVVTAFRGNPMLETVREVAPRCPELREIICFDDWAAFIAAGDDDSIALPDGQADRSGDDPVHLGHHRLSEGRAAASSRPRQQRRRHRRAHGDRPGRRLHHHHAAVPHRRLRLLRARRGIQGGDAGAAGSIRAWPRARTVSQTYRGNAMVGVPTMLVAMLEHPSFAIDRSVIGQGDLFRRLDRAGRAGHMVRAKARRAVHHRVRADGMLAGGGP